MRGTYERGQVVWKSVFIFIIKKEQINRTIMFKDVNDMKKESKEDNRLYAKKRITRRQKREPAKKTRRLQLNNETKITPKKPLSRSNGRDKVKKRRSRYKLTKRNKFSNQNRKKK